MANIQLQRGQQQQVDVTFKLSGQTDSANLSSNKSAKLVIRRSLTGAIIDTLTGVAGNSNLRIILGAGGGATIPNINLKWSTADAAKLPNESVTVIGDLKIADDSTFASGEIIHHIRLTFDIIPEVV
tara:strand:- start:758 stop:1138 length:381 start_codon:yes stop_codon:yes gene_type:complete